MNEFEPEPSTIEAMHLAGQQELMFCMNALVDLAHIPEIQAISDKLLDRYVDLNMEIPE